jgi:L-histidine N-alpha-methyltransferase
LTAFTIETYLRDGEFFGSMARDVLAGLSAVPRSLPPKYFYDDEGCRLFEEITRLPEYYPTRAEASLLRKHAPSLMSTLAPREIVELGSGSSTKTRILLDAQSSSRPVERYVPFDVAGGAIADAAGVLTATYPGLAVHGIVGDFERHLGLIPPSDGDRAVLFLGSTIGNLDGASRHNFLIETRRLLAPGDHFLLGVDQVKDIAVLEAAYNDSAGITAAFNRNILRAINAGLDANFQPEAFRHEAFYNADMARIEMHLCPEEPQSVRLEKIDLSVEIAASESIWTESSYKFTRESTTDMLRQAGLALVDWLQDDDRLFALAVTIPA